MSLKEMWRQHAQAVARSPSEVEEEEKQKKVDIPLESDMFSCTELVLSKDESKVIEKTRNPGENNVAMVAWKMTLKTPGEKTVI